MTLNNGCGHLTYIKTLALNIYDFAGDHMQYYRNNLIIFPYFSPVMETCEMYPFHPPRLIPVGQQFSVPFPQILGFELTDLIRDKVRAQAP